MITKITTMIGVSDNTKFGVVFIFIDFYNLQTVPKITKLLRATKCIHKKLSGKVTGKLLYEQTLQHTYKSSHVQ